jgi:PAS domain S-box-containing protein
MASISYPFIDIAVLDGVREHLASGRAVVVLCEKLDCILLANARGAALLGFDEPFDIVGENPKLGLISERVIHALDFSSGVAIISLRLNGEMQVQDVATSINPIILPSGQKAITLSWPEASQSPESIITKMADDYTHFAILDHEHTLLAVSEKFSSLNIPDFDLAQLVTQARNSPDRIIKKRLSVNKNSIPIGIGRLRDEPALFILVGVSDQSAAVQTLTISDKTHKKSVADMKNISNDRNTASIAPVRFTWQTDRFKRFCFVSNELSRVIGSNSADIVGRQFKDIATVFAFDQGDEISDLFEKRDPWSGRTILWPIADTNLRVPIDLAALPIYDRHREFEGFRGYGVVRLDDAIVDNEDIGTVLMGQTSKLPQDAWRGEVPAITLNAPIAPERMLNSNIVHLDERRQEKVPPLETLPLTAINKPELTSLERNAFREIANRLRGNELMLQEPVASAASPTSAFHDQDLVVKNTRNESFAKDLEVFLEKDRKNTHTPLSRETHSFVALEKNNTSVALFQKIDSKSEQFARELELFLENDKHARHTPLARELRPITILEKNNKTAAVFQKIPDDETALEIFYETDTVPDDAPILAKLPVPILIHNGANLLYGNPAFFKLTQYSSLDDLNHEGGLEHLLHVSSPDEGNIPPTSKILMADKNEIPVRAHLHTVRWKGQSALLLSLRPLTQEQAKTDNAHLIETLNREIKELSSVLEIATDGVVFVNNDGTIRSINQSTEALFGFGLENVVGKPFSYLLAHESQKSANEYIINMAGNGASSLINDGREIIGREAQGRFIPLFMTVGKLDTDTGYCVVLRDITQWKRAEEDLNAAKHAAEHSSTQKTEFLARVSHEIRTPLNAIIGFSELMSEERFGPVTNPRYLDYLNDINKSGRHVLDLVNDLLDISKIEAGEHEMNFTSVALNEILSTAVSIMQPQANRERVIIRSSFASDLLPVLADARSIKQIALNLLSNAVRYTRAGGQVTISTLQEITGGVSIRVHDNGIGMSAQEIEQALKPFKQINTLQRERGDGTGLGLPLTKALAEANKATFMITSTPEEGTIVEIMFPYSRVVADK